MNQEQAERVAKAMEIFTPREAIRSKEHLAGRQNEITKVISGVFQKGAHIVIYGDRGVGKTSLAHCVAESLAAGESIPLVLGPTNCDTGDNFNSVWKKIFSKIDLTEVRQRIGLTAESEEGSVPLLDQLPSTLTPFDVQGALDALSGKAGVVVMLDEFERLPDGKATRLTADLIKGLSDQGIQATVVLIGVAESVTQLIKGHESINRHLVEVHVPRLIRPERLKILSDRMPALGLIADDDAARVIASMSRGLPFYIHLLGQKAAVSAIVDGSDRVLPEHLARAVSLAIDESDGALRDAYYDATRTTHKSRYAETLAACALAKCDDFGYFTTKDVVPVLSRILGEPRTPGSIMDRLEKMASPERGQILVSTGKKYDRRFRFKDPIVQPFVVLKSVEAGIISLEDISSNEQQQPSSQS